MCVSMCVCVGCTHVCVSGGGGARLFVALQPYVLNKMLERNKISVGKLREYSSRFLIGKMCGSFCTWFL